MIQVARGQTSSIGPEILFLVGACFIVGGWFLSRLTDWLPLPRRSDRDRRPKPWMIFVPSGLVGFALWILAMWKLWL